MNIQKRVTILSAELKGVTSKRNAERTSDLEALLIKSGYKYSMADGSYKGSLEKSFIVDSSEDNITHLKVLASYYGQESILVVDEYRQAALHFFDGRIENLGTLVHVSRIDGLDSWTKVSNEYFTVVDTVNTQIK